MSKQSIIQQIASKIISLVSNHNSDSSAHQSLFNAKLNVSDAFSGDYEDLDNKPSIPTKTSDLNNDSNFLTSHQDITGKEDKSNKVTILSALSTDIQYPSAKIVYNSLSNKEDKSKKVTTLSTNSTNDEYPSAKAVYDAIHAIPSPEFVEITSNKGTASASTMKKFYVEVGNNKRDVYYTEENNGSYSWHKLDTDILDDLSIDWEDIQNKPSTMTPTSHTDSNGAYGKATTSVWGHTKLNSATNSTSTTESATPSAVKAAYDLANGKPSLGTTSTTAAKGDHNHDGTYLKSYTPPTASTSQAGIVQLNNATNSNSETTAATSKAVKEAYTLANGKLDLTGGTMTGNIKIPSKYESTSGATGNIPFAGNLDKSSQSLTDALPTLKSLTATIYDNDSQWWNILSIRHRNGSNDGSRYGLYLKSLLTGNGDLIWNKQYGSNGTWVGERTILDSNNYSNYANKTTVENNLSSDSTTNALSAKMGKSLADNIRGKVDKVSGKSLVTDSEITKLSHVEDYANKTTVENNLTSTSTTNALSAKMGKDLQNNKASKTHSHAFGVLNSGDIDNLTEDGVYGISKAKINDETITGTFPPTTRTNGVKSFILEQRNYSSGNYIQFAYPLTSSEDYNRIFYRTYTTSNWDTWREIVQISDINAINTALDGKAPLSHSHDDVVAGGASGFMTGSDKTKLNGIATGATKNTVTNSLTSTSTTNALSAKMGNQLNTDKANKTDIIKMAFYTSNNLNSGILSSAFISVAKNSYLYIGCTDGNGNAVSGNIMVDYGGLAINLELTNGMAKIQATMTGEFIVNACYYYLGYYKASMMAKVTVS